MRLAGFVTWTSTKGTGEPGWARKSGINWKTHLTPKEVGELSLEAITGEVGELSLEAINRRNLVGVNIAGYNHGLDEASKPTADLLANYLRLVLTYKLPQLQH